jgi:hypothetical protein
MSAQGFAKLTSALIARKGHAVPSGYGSTSTTPAAPAPIARNSRPVAQSPTPVAGLGKGAQKTTEVAGRVRVSLRINDERHLRLRLTASHMQTTLQDILTQALDNYLDQLGPEVIRNNCLCLNADEPSTKQ